MTNLNEYVDEINNKETHTTKKETKKEDNKSKVYTFYIKGEDIEAIEDLIEKVGNNKVGEFIRKTIEKQHNIKFKSDYENKGRRKKD